MITVLKAVHRTIPNASDRPGSFVYLRSWIELVFAEPPYTSALKKVSFPSRDRLVQGAQYGSSQK